MLELYFYIQDILFLVWRYGGDYDAKRTKISLEIPPLAR